MPDSKISPYRAIRILAAAEVFADPAKQSVDYQIRKILREFSARFSIPLDRVEQMSLGWVLRHYWESSYEDKVGGDHHEAEEARRELLQLAGSDEDAAAEMRGHLAADDMKFFEEAMKSPVIEKAFAKIPEQLQSLVEPPQTKGQAEDTEIFKDFGDLTEH